MADANRNSSELVEETEARERNGADDTQPSSSRAKRALSSKTASVNLPMARVKRIVKADKGTSLVDTVVF